jgi:hypothetical protein
MTPHRTFPVFRVWGAEGWGQWRQSITALIRGRGGRVLYQGWRKKTVRRFVAKERSQTAEFVLTVTVSVKGVGPSRATPFGESTRVRDDDDRGAVVGGGRVRHERF